MIKLIIKTKLQRIKSSLSGEKMDHVQFVKDSINRGLAVVINPALLGLDRTSQTYTDLDSLQARLLDFHEYLFALPDEEFLKANQAYQQHIVDLGINQRGYTYYSHELIQEEISYQMMIRNIEGNRNFADAAEIAKSVEAAIAGVRGMEREQNQDLLYGFELIEILEKAQQPRPKVHKLTYEQLEKIGEGLLTVI